MIEDPYVPPRTQLDTGHVSKRAAIKRMVSAVAISTVCASFTMIRISNVPYFGSDQFVLQAFPYLLLITHAMSCWKSALHANISLIGSLLIGGCGVVLIYSAGKEIDLLGFTPFILVAGFFLVLVVQCFFVAFKRK